MTGDSENIGFRLRTLAATQADVAAIIAPYVTLTTARLWRLVDCFACRMADIGIDRDSRVGLATDDGIVAIAAMFASALLGAEFTIVDHFIMRRPALRPTHFLRSVDYPPLDHVDFQVIDHTWSPKSSANSADGGVSWPGYASGDSPAWIVHSSGTTGQPKFMRLSADNMGLRVGAVMTDYADGCCRMASLFFAGSRPYLIRVAAAILAGVTVIDSRDAAFLQSHETDLITGSPRLVRDWLAQSRIDSTFQRLQCSGARLSAEDLAFFLRFFDQVDDIYGSSETIKAYLNSSMIVGGRIVTKGKPAIGTKLEIVAEDGSICPKGTLGNVRIRNAFLATGYFEDPDATARSFRGGWFHPGDLAVWRDGNVLDLKGRAKDVINLGGLKLSLSDLDNILTSARGIARAACFRHPAPSLQDCLAAIVELSDGILQSGAADAAVHAAHQACRDAYGPDAAPRDIVVVDRVPLTQDGMPRRADCQEVFLEALTQARSQI